MGTLLTPGDHTAGRKEPGTQPQPLLSTRPRAGRVCWSAREPGTGGRGCSWYLRTLKPREVGGPVSVHRADGRWDCGRSGLERELFPVTTALPAVGGSSPQERPGVQEQQRLPGGTAGRVLTAWL